MREAHSIERAVGMGYYASETDGTGGSLRASPADFRVREIERFDTRPLDADPDAYPHLVCRVTLRGWDTNDFAQELSNRLGMSRERVDWAGTKDKRAISTQLVSVRGPDLDPGDVPPVANAEIEPVGRAGRGLRFGDLAGNAFEVAVNEPRSPENAAAITDELRAFGGSGTDPEHEGGPESETGQGNGDEGYATIGVPNYFGQQRFGSRRPVTHTVGLAIARGNWEEAVMSYVGNPHEAEPAATQEARRFVSETRDWTAAIGEFPGGLRYERALCERLAEREREREGKAGTNAGTAGPEDFRAALDVLPRNLQRLFVNAAQSSLFNRVVTERLERGLPFDRVVPGDVVCFADRDAPDDLPLPDVGRTQRVSEDRVGIVDRHCARGQAFVTAPLIGTETELSDGEPGAIEREVLAEAGLSTADFDLPEPYYSSGTRRAICLRTDVTVGEDPLRFRFRLPKGSYATTLLREYLKAPPEHLG